MHNARQSALITGANSGLGQAMATALAAEGMDIGIVARDAARGERARELMCQQTGNPRVRLYVADLADQQSVRALAEAVLKDFEQLHVLINNAATAFPRRRLSPDGIECALAVNHLAPFLLTHLLLERLKGSAPARILHVGTRMNTALDFDDLNWERRRYRMMQAYGQSKLGLLHQTFELARRLQGSGVTVNCVFPGVFKSNLGGTDGAQGPGWKLIALLLGWALPTPEQAAKRVLRLMRDPSLADMNGCYFDGRQPLTAPRQARDLDANRRLWQISEHLTGQQPDRVQIFKPAV
ncbi:General stress protein 39 [Thiorhodovibrio winogradskyi]|uniref:General stress protein 39 n=1 Tax=Thiorhodovibrio winogradskyi TaxID=77007 RepID=A0ABZ0S4X4_9GAMM|nr:SDR family NAD(P)-dependent oxidoreductase [Thiorhodovibrio winogradskyi]